MAGFEWGDCVVGRIVKNYLMYDHIAASLYRKMIVETDGTNIGYAFHQDTFRLAPRGIGYFFFVAIVFRTAAD